MPGRRGDRIVRHRPGLPDPGRILPGGRRRAVHDPVRHSRRSGTPHGRHRAARREDRADKHRTHNIRLPAFGLRRSARLYASAARKRCPARPETAACGGADPQLRSPVGLRRGAVIRRNPAAPQRCRPALLPRRPDKNICRNEFPDRNFRDGRPSTAPRRGPLFPPYAAFPPVRKPIRRRQRKRMRLHPSDPSEP